ncbi:hypothetical protein BD311DRAFT_265716 [Dichomitus squalens]|uniref:Uncharacterized protein n=1 Tax=Dichomitus squalens TaxID=114155 RepID=A0A4Q9MPX7_9APHY|nr:hypothetical protein BD311DRAFT_265716 [Dichomitus squalens]
MTVFCVNSRRGRHTCPMDDAQGLTCFVWMTVVPGGILFIDWRLDSGPFHLNGWTQPCAEAVIRLTFLFARHRISASSFDGDRTEAVVLHVRGAHVESCVDGNIRSPLIRSFKFRQLRGYRKSPVLWGCRACRYNTYCTVARWCDDLLAS